jgi:hypothetical protein
MRIHKIIFHVVFIFLVFTSLKAQEVLWWKIMKPEAFEKLAKNPVDARKLLNNLWWQDYDTVSVAKNKQVKVEHLVGIWSAYRQSNSPFMPDTNRLESDYPFGGDTIYFTKGGFYHRNASEKTARFELDNNIITIPMFTYYSQNLVSDDSGIGIINKITANELIITWQNGKKKNAKLIELLYYTRTYYHRVTDLKIKPK